MVQQCFKSTPEMQRGYLAMTWLLVLVTRSGSCTQLHMGLQADTNLIQQLAQSRKLTSGMDSKEVKLRKICLKQIRGTNILNKDELLNELLKCQFKEHKKMLRAAEDQDSLYERAIFMGEAPKPYKQNYTDKVVNPHDFNYIHRPESCKSEHKVLISIHSSTTNYRKRSCIRNTWGNPRVFKKYLPKGWTPKLIFILGANLNASVQNLIDYEWLMYKDILQADFIDNYRNNTYKAIYHMKWAASMCATASIILKADDDIMINPRKFPAFLKNFTTEVGGLDPHKHLIAGNMYKLGPIRSKESKWYLSYEEYPYDTFPLWFQGMVYFITPSLAKAMFELSYTTPYIFTDDVYVGILSDRVPDVYRHDLHEYYDFAYGSFLNRRLKWIYEKYAFYHNPTINDMYNLWGVICGTRKNCKYRSKWLEMHIAIG